MMSEHDQSTTEFILKNLDSHSQQITVIGLTLGLILGEVSEADPEVARRIHRNLELVKGQLNNLITDKRAIELQELLIRATALKE